MLNTKTKLTKLCFTKYHHVFAIFCYSAQNHYLLFIFLQRVMFFDIKKKCEKKIGKMIQQWPFFWKVLINIGIIWCNLLSSSFLDHLCQFLLIGQILVYETQFLGINCKSPLVSIIKMKMQMKLELCRRLKRARKLLWLTTGNNWPWKIGKQDKTTSGTTGVSGRLIHHSIIFPWLDCNIMGKNTSTSSYPSFNSLTVGRFFLLTVR